MEYKIMGTLLKNKSARFRKLAISRSVNVGEQWKYVIRLFFIQGVQKFGLKNGRTIKSTRKIQFKFFYMPWH